MLGKAKRQSYQKSSNTENRGFNSALYFNAQNLKNVKKLEIETRDSKLEKRRKFGLEATPKSIDTPQSTTSGIDLKKCLSRDLFNKIEESSPTKSRGSINDMEEIFEVITPDFENPDDSSDNIIINLQNAQCNMDNLSLEESNQYESTNHTNNTNNGNAHYPNTQSYFYRENTNFNNNNFHQYNSNPNQIGFFSNTMQMNVPQGYYIKNNSEGNLLNSNNIINEKKDFSKLFKINDYKKEESVVTNNITKDTKNITKKTINNQDINGWTCTQCKNFNYESKIKI